MTQLTAQTDRKLNNGVAMPPLGLGVWQARPGSQTWRAVAWALAAGYRLIDTARLYMNERSVGRAVHKAISAGLKREDIFVTTKLWNNAHGYDAALRAFDASLDRLGLDYIDLYLIHWPAGGQIAETWRAFEHILESGRARAIGVSNFAVHDLTELLTVAQVVPAVNQIAFHPYIFAQQQATLAFCDTHDIAVEAYSPLGRGQLLGNPVIADMAQAHGKTPAQVILRWAVQHTTIPIPKSVHRDRIIENISIFDFELNEAELQRIDQLG